MGRFLVLFPPWNEGKVGRKEKKIPEKCVAEEKVQIGGMIGSSFFLGVFSGHIVRFWV